MENLSKNEIADLVKLLSEKREEVRAFRFGTAGSLTRNVRSVRTAKRDIARILTELNVRNRAKATA